MHYAPIDISESMLRATPASLASDYPRLRIDALATDYLNGLTVLPAAQRRLALPAPAAVEAAQASFLDEVARLLVQGAAPGENVDPSTVALRNSNSVSVPSAPRRRSIVNCRDGGSDTASTSATPSATRIA